MALLVGLLVARTLAEGAGASLVSDVQAGKKPRAPEFELAVIWPHAETWPAERRAALADGRLSLRELRGYPVVMNFWAKVVVLTFLESKCEEACPIIAAQVARAMERLSAEERRDVLAIAISTHPGDDTPANVRAFLRAQGAEGKLHYLIGSERELRPVWERFDVLSALDSGDADTHSASVHVYDRDGEWVSSLHPGIDLTPAALAYDVVTALAE